MHHEFRTVLLNTTCARSWVAKILFLEVTKDKDQNDQAHNFHLIFTDISNKHKAEPVIGSGRQPRKGGMRVICRDILPKYF